MNNEKELLLAVVNQLEDVRSGIEKLLADALAYKAELGGSDSYLAGKIMAYKEVKSLLDNIEGGE